MSTDRDGLKTYEKILKVAVMEFDADLLAFETQISKRLDEVLPDRYFLESLRDKLGKLSRRQMGPLQRWLWSLLVVLLAGLLIYGLGMRKKTRN